MSLMANQQMFHKKQLKRYRNDHYDANMREKKAYCEKIMHLIDFFLFLTLFQQFFLNANGK